MTPQQLIDRKVAPCFGGGQHPWRQTDLMGCETCGSHSGFACDTCEACVDFVWDQALYQAIVQIGYLEMRHEDDSQSEEDKGERSPADLSGSDDRNVL